MTSTPIGWDTMLPTDIKPTFKPAQPVIARPKAPNKWKLKIIVGFFIDDVNQQEDNPGWLVQDGTADHFVLRLWSQDYTLEAL